MEVLFTRWGPVDRSRFRSKAHVPFTNWRPIQRSRSCWDSFHMRMQLHIIPASGCCRIIIIYRWNSSVCQTFTFTGTYPVQSCTSHPFHMSTFHLRMCIVFTFADPIHSRYKPSSQARIPFICANPIHKCTLRLHLHSMFTPREGWEGGVVTWRSFWYGCAARHVKTHLIHILGLWK